MKKLKQYMLREGVTQAAMAEMTGATQPTIQRLIAGLIEDPHIKLVLAIERATKGHVKPGDWA